MDSGRIGLNPGFVGTIQGILKIAEIVCSILTFALAAGAEPILSWIGYSVGWVIFSGVVAFIVATIFFLLYLINAYPDVFNRFKIEVIVNITMAVFLLISGIVAAVASGRVGGEPYHGSAGAASFFAFLSMVLFAVDAILLFFNQKSELPPSTTTNANPPSEYTSQNAVY